MTLPIALEVKSLQPLPLNRAVGVLETHGKSFHFAGRLLAASQLQACARLYSFCRYLDDLADSSADGADSFRRLLQIYNELQSAVSFDPVVNDFLALAQEHRINMAPVTQLIQGLLSDLDTVRIKDSAQLKRYCYRVAGTVGLLMCDVLGVRDPRAHKHAIDLGIAMQLTNIARDVAEDARNQRRYLPENIVGNLSPKLIANADVWHREDLTTGVKALLDEAERYYKSGEQGLAYLPWRARIAILVAARVYRAIGHQLAGKGYATWLGRAQVSRRAKFIIAAKTIFEFCSRPRFHVKLARHDQRLHRPLRGLPGSYLTEPSR
ncbi:MAG: phytoene/squalene synthase family protein [Gammaproteobacteria bacterium]|nr:phytoene/squalene synthase family protein [Gammaproteobacteria bacterium]